MTFVFIYAVAALFVMTAAPPAGPVAPVKTAGEVSNGDYPESAIRAGEQGETVARLHVRKSGTPDDCKVAKSSGSAALDRVTCTLFLARYRYRPARDARGWASAAWVTQRIRWVLPEIVPRAAGLPPLSMGVCVRWFPGTKRIADIRVIDGTGDANEDASFAEALRGQIFPAERGDAAGGWFGLRLTIDPGPDGPMSTEPAPDCSGLNAGEAVRVKDVIDEMGRVPAKP